MGNIIGEELARAFGSTSIKGVGRIFKAEYKTLKLLWFTTSVASICMAIYLSMLLVGDYFHFDVSTSIEERNIEILRDSNTEHLPAMVVCNLNPFSSNASFSSDGVRSPLKYFEFVTESTACESCTPDEKREREALRKRLLSPIGYYQYAGPENAQKFGHKEEDFILNCDVIELDGMVRKKRPCKEYFAINVLTTPDFLNCFSFIRHGASLQSLRVRPMIGLSLTLYLDNLHAPIINASHMWSHDASHDLADDFSHWGHFHSGVRIVFHDRDTAPVIQASGKNLPAGFLSTLEGELLERTRQPAPYGTCRTNTETKYSYKNITVHYSQYSCFSHCMEIKVREQCGCIDINSMGIMEYTYLARDIPFCETIAYGADYAKERGICAAQIRDTTFRECLESCPIPCKESQYKHAISYARWPDLGHHLQFYNRYIKGKPFAHRFKVYEEILANEEGDTYRKLVENARLIEDNFMKMDVYLKRPVYVELTDTPKIELSGLLSQLGGTLNLWAGITVVISIEFLDLLYRICRRFMCPSKKRDLGKQPAESEMHLQEKMPEKKLDDRYFSSMI